MKTNKRKSIDGFFSAKKYAVAGVSRNENKFGNAILKELSGKGYRMVGVNPHMTEVAGLPCFASVSDLPADVDALITSVKPETTLSVVKAAHEKGIRNVWMQQGSQSEEAIAFAESKGMNVVYRECIMMYGEPVESFHKFHRSLKKLFGGYHKPL